MPYMRKEITKLETCHMTRKLSKAQHPPKSSHSLRRDEIRKECTTISIVLYLRTLSRPAAAITVQRMRSGHLRGWRAEKLEKVESYEAEEAENVEECFVAAESRS